MPKIIPFKGIIPNPELAYSIVNGKEFNSFPLISLLFEEYFSKGQILQEISPCFYLYRIQNPERSFTGIWASTSVEDLNNGNIRKHEKIHTERSVWVQEMFRDKKIDFNPILLTYSPSPELDLWMVETLRSSPFLSMVEESEKTVHEIWKITESNILEKIQKIFHDLNPVYLADGHHRAEAFQNWAEEEEKMNFDYPKIFPGFTSIYFSIKEVEIKAYHRVFTLKDNSLLKFCMDKISEIFDLEKMTHLEVPHKKGDFFLINFQKDRYKMTLKKGITLELGGLNPPNLARKVMEHLDVSILQDLVFHKCFGIGTDQPLGELNYHGGRHAEEMIEEKVFSGEYSIGFFLAPPEFEEIKIISDSGLFMPQKSTYFEPKIPSGLIIQKLDPRLKS